MSIGTSNISFSSLVSTHNSVNNPDLSTSNIKLSNFRSKTFTNGTSVPASGAISINSHFKGKTWGSPPFGISVHSRSYFMQAPQGGNGTQSSPYYGKSENKHDGSTSYIEWIVSGSGTVHVRCEVWSEQYYDYGAIHINGSRIGKYSGAHPPPSGFSNNDSGWLAYNMSHGQKVKFEYSKDYSISYSDDEMTYYIRI